jgi:hypothetical protein
MRVSNIGFGVLGGVAALGAAFSALVAMGACGGSATVWSDAGTGGSSGGGNCGVLCPPPSGSDGGGSSSGGGHPTAPAVGTVIAPDCAGCTFPPSSAPTCAASAPAIKIVYPPDNVLVPPNMNVMSVQWTPFGGPYTQYEVDFSQSQQAPNTDWRIITACKTQTVDAQSGNPSQGCELVIDPASWSSLVAANRGANQVAVTVRGTTDGNCATTSASTIHMSFAEEDLIGTYYYWKSTVSTNGVGGQIWAKDFGDITNAEKDVTTNAIQAATCNGCHSLSRDGSRMVVYSDDDDSDDEYSDVAGSYLNMTTMPNATEFAGGVTGVRVGGQPPGFSTINPVASFYVSSNGYPCAAGRGGCGTSTGYPGAVPTNGFSLWNGTNGAFVGGVTIGPAGQRPTMPDWSIDGTTVVYVQPAGEYTWRQDDAHIFGGSLYTVPYMGNGVFGTPGVFLQSGGENNYYPSYSPDNPMSYIIFNRVENMGGGNACNGGFCPNDSFSNPAARLMLIANAKGSTPVDMEKANGSPASAKVPLSNSYPRWAPFVQSYHGNKLLWFTFSSTRDYGVRVLNHKTGMFQCYPADAAETPGGAHRQPFGASCQEPQLWMAPLTFTEAQGVGSDPSGVAFWIPYQDIKTHNHTAQWTVQNGHTTPPPGGCVCATIGQACVNTQCGCCAQLTCSGNGTCINGLQ